MKSRFLLIPLACAALASAAQDSFKHVRTLKEGDKDVYAMTIKMATQMGAMDMSMTISQLIKKLYPNGDADQESTITNMTVNMMGRTQNVPSQPAQTVRINKFGIPVNAAKAGGGRMNMNFLEYARAYGDTELKLNVPFKIDYADPNDAKNKVSGTVTLTALTDKQATIKGDMNVWTAQTGGEAIHVIMTSLVDRASGKPDKVDSKVDKIPAAMTQGFQIDNMEITMTRKG